MLVYRTDKNGIWTGEAREIGPKDGRARNEVPHDPPQLSEGQFAQWRGRVWVVLDAYPVEPVRRDKLADLAHKRWQVETGGITASGVAIQTDRASQSMVTSAALAAQLGPEMKIRWKTASGDFVALDAAQIVGIATLVRLHVQNCFGHEADLTALIAAAETVADLDAIDINAGWPDEVEISE